MIYFGESESMIKYEEGWINLTLNTGLVSAIYRLDNQSKQMTIEMPFSPTC